MELSFEIWPNAPYEGLDIVGVPTNSWGHKPVEWCIERTASHGYKAVDLIFDKFLEMEEREYRESIERIPDLVRSLGVTIASIGAHHLSITPKRWKVEGAMRLMKQAIDLASDLGVPTVVSYVAGYYYPPTYILMTYTEAKDFFVSNIRELCRYAQERGVIFSIEPHDCTIINTPAVTIELMERIDMDNLALTLDIGGVELGMKAHMPVEEIIQMFGSKINHVHAKDVTGTIGNWNMCWFGAGLVNFQRYADALRSIGYDGYVCVEWEGWFRGGFQGVGDTYGSGLDDFDRVAREGKEILGKYFE